MEFKTKYGRSYEIDLDKWRYTQYPVCRIVGETEAHLILENKDKETAKVPKSVIEENKLEIPEDKVAFTAGLYGYYFTGPLRDQAVREMNRLFEENCGLIFKQRELVLSRPEFYLLRPDMLANGGYLLGGFNFSLGVLMESIQSGNHIHFDEIGDYHDVFLINLVGSSISGFYSAHYWAEKEGTVFSIDSSKDGKILRPFLPTLKRFNELLTGPETKIDFQDKTMASLVQLVAK